MIYKYLDSAGEHMHTLGGRPLIGTSSVASVLSKPLTYWASGLAVMQLGVPDAKILTKVKNKAATVEEVKALYASCGVFLELLKGMEVESYVKLMQKAYTAHATTLKDKAVEGTDLHAELERFVKWHMGEKKDNDYGQFDPKIQPFIEWTIKNVKRFIYSESHCYSEKLWVGGISDCAAELNDGKVVVIDFKSSKEAYPVHFFQIAGYDLEIEENGWFDRNGKLLGKLEKKVEGYIVVPFGASIIQPVYSDRVDVYKDMFKHTLALYKFLNI